MEVFVYMKKVLIVCCLLLLFYGRYEPVNLSLIHIFTAFFKEPFLILTGGPGTGKTTIVKGILDLYQRYYPSDTIALCAPTGRCV